MKKNKLFHENIRKQLSYSENDRILEEVAQKGGAGSILGDVYSQNLAGPRPE